MLSDAQLRALPFAELDRERQRAAARTADTRAMVRRTEQEGLDADHEEDLEFAADDYYERVHAEWTARLLARDPDAAKYLRVQATHPDEPEVPRDPGTIRPR
jgi:hypothetical protein